MNTCRTLISARPRLALLMLAIALFARVFVPTGYMVMPSAGGFAVQMCSGQGSTPVLLNTESNTTAPTGDHRDTGKMDAPCAFSGLGMAALAAVDAVLLIAAIAFVVALGTRTSPQVAAQISSRLRPPLRAPPIFG